jgi:hypothetical protein
MSFTAAAAAADLLRYGAACKFRHMALPGIDDAPAGRTHETNHLLLLLIFVLGTALPAKLATWRYQA